MFSLPSKNDVSTLNSVKKMMLAKFHMNANHQLFDIHKSVLANIASCCMFFAGFNKNVTYNGHGDSYFEICRVANINISVKFNDVSNCSLKIK